MAMGGETGTSSGSPLLIPIAHPLATREVSEAILREVEGASSPVSGIKACCKSIRKGDRVLIVLSGMTVPMDLISHMPVLCEERGIPYIFVPGTQWMRGYTCVALDTSGDTQNMKWILTEAKTRPE